MLVLSRKIFEGIVIGGNLFVGIVEIRGEKVRLGIEAPKEISIHRHEVFEYLNPPKNKHQKTFRERLISRHTDRHEDPNYNLGVNINIPTSGMESLKTFRNSMDSPPEDDASLITALLDVVAEKGLTLEDLKCLPKKG